METRRRKAAPSPDSFRNSLFYWANRLENRYNLHFIKAMRPVRVTVARFRVLAVLMEFSDLTVNELAEDSSVERSALSRLLDQLEAEGLIQRREKRSDRRALEIRITEAGRTAFRAMRPVRGEILKRATQGIAPADVEHMLKVIQRMAHNLEGQAAAPRNAAGAGSSSRARANGRRR